MDKPILQQSASSAHSDGNATAERGRDDRASTKPSESIVRRRNDAAIKVFRDNVKSLKKGEELAANTVIQYCDDVQAFAVQYTGNNPGQSILEATKQDIQDYLSLQKQKGLAPQTVNRYHVSLGRFFGVMIDAGYISSNPATGVKKMPWPTGDDRPVNILSAEKLRIVHEITKRLATEDPVNGARNACIIFLALYGGMRSGELIALTPQDVGQDFKSVSAAGRTVRVLHDDLYESLQTHYSTIVSRAAFHERELSYMFTDANRPHRALTRQSIFHAVKGIGAEAGFAPKTNPLNLRLLRNTGGVIMLNSSHGNLRLVQTFMGHTDISTTRSSFGNYDNMPEYALLRL